MRQVLGLIAATCITAGSPLWAASLTINFCPDSASCPGGVYEASLTFTEILNDDPNDYYLDVWIKGDSSAPAYVDQLSFSISGVQTSGGYELQPTLLDAPGGGQPWVMFWDNVSASAKSCTKDTTHSQEVCTQSGPNNQSNFGAPLPGEELHWLYLVDFTGSVQLSTDTIVNLRAQFLDSAGKNAGILSPAGGQLTRVPEPSSLLLCVAGFIATVGRLRRRTAIHKS